MDYSSLLAEAESYKVLIAIALLTLGGVILVPRVVVCMALGASVGWSGVLIAMIGSALGSSLGFALARWLLQRRIEAYLATKPQILAVVRAVDLEGWRVVGLFRLASPIPGALLNYAFGITRISFTSYIVATLVGVLPQTIVFTYLGMVGGSLMQQGALRTLNIALLVAGVAFMLVAFFRIKAGAQQKYRQLMLKADAPNA